MDGLERMLILRETNDLAPICPRCGVTKVPAALSSDGDAEGDWVCLECEELDWAD